MIHHSQPWISPAELDAAQKVLQSAALSRGENMEALEVAMASYLKKNHALFTGNGSQAQALILAGMGIGPGDEVIVPSYVCNKVFTAVTAIGATPVLCDIGENWVMTPAETGKKISEKTRAIVLPHVYGINAWDAGFLSFGIPVIEDVCQSLGHVRAENRTGTYSDFSFTSFHGTKCIAAGEGGMLLVNDAEVFERIKKIRSQNPLFTSGTDVIAAIALSLLQRYAEILQNRNAIAEKYNRELPAILNYHYAGLTETSMNYRYVLRSSKDFESIRKAFLEKGVHVRKGVDNLIHREQGFADSEFPNSVRCFDQAVSIPILPQLNSAQQNLVVEAVLDLHSKGVL